MGCLMAPNRRCARDFLRQPCAPHARRRTPEELFPTLKTKGYHLEHNFGHGKKYLSSLLAAMNMLASRIRFFHAGLRKILWAICAPYGEMFPQPLDVPFMVPANAVPCTGISLPYSQVFPDRNFTIFSGVGSEEARAVALASVRRSNRMHGLMRCGWQSHLPTLPNSRPRHGRLTGEDRIVPTAGRRCCRIYLRHIRSVREDECRSERACHPGR